MPVQTGANVRIGAAKPGSPVGELANPSISSGSGYRTAGMLDEIHEAHRSNPIEGEQPGTIATRN